MIDLYEVLQVDRRAEPEVIRAAYRALARKNHPDFGGDVRQMATVNEAWAVLGDPARRAAYDAEPQALGFRPDGSAAPATDRPDNGESGNGARHGLAGRRPQQPHGGGSVLDFGRYAGWTVGSLVDHDPDYLVWLARTPIGRPLVAEIDEALARRAAESPVRPSTGPQPPRRRAFL
jgi:curved DNA-binding protein CbpA